MTLYAYKSYNHLIRNINDKKDYRMYLKKLICLQVPKLLIYSNIFIINIMFPKERLAIDSISYGNNYTLHYINMENKFIIF